MASNVWISDNVADIPAAALDQFVMALSDRINEEVLKRPRLSQREQDWFEGEFKTFDDHFQKILVNKDKQQKEMALRAVASALCLSYYHAGGPLVAREIEAKTRKNGTKKANEAQENKVIREIIRRHKPKLLANRPKLRERDTELARALFEPVLNDLSNSGDIGEDWIVKDPMKPTADEKRRIVENIRGQIRRMKMSGE